MRINLLRSFVLSLVLVMGLASTAQAQTRVTLKSASSTSSYYVMMVQLAEMLRTASDGGIQPTVEESQGSVQNVKEAARRPGAFVFTTPPSLLASARAGTGQFEGETGYDSIRSLAVVPFITIHLVVGANTGIDTVSDLAGRTFIPGGTGTFCEGRTKSVLGLLGVLDAMDLVDTELNNAAPALRNQRVAGFATCSSHPVPLLQELATTTPVNILSLSDEQRAAIMAEDPLAGPITIAANTYPGQTEPVDTVAVPVGLFTTEHMDDDTAYTIVRSFWEQRDQLAEESAWWSGVSPQLVMLMNTPLHPGALRYYQEIGLDIPDNMR